MPSAPTAPTCPNPKGHPEPEDQFVSIGQCPTTGRDLTLCYRTYGNPAHPCLLMVMGLGGTLLYWNPELIAQLVQIGFFVVCYDHRDVGLSTHMDGLPTPFIARMILPAWASVGEGVPPYQLEDMAEDAVRLLTALKIDAFHLLGSSMGGMLVQCIALRAPTRVKSLAIVFSHSGGPQVKPQTFGMSLAFLDRPASSSMSDMLDFKVRQARRFMGDYELEEEAYRASTQRTLERCPEDKKGLLRQIWAIQRAGSRVEGLRRLNRAPLANNNNNNNQEEEEEGEELIRFPVLVLHGMQDTMIPFENGLELVQLIAGARLVAFSRMGHSLPRPLWPDIVAEMQIQLERGEAMAAAAASST